VQCRTFAPAGDSNGGMSSCPECGLDPSDLDPTEPELAYLDPTFLDHCHGTLIVHRDRSVECTDPGCELPDLLRHAFIVDCIALGGCCTTEAFGDFATAS
jgi:hypothetical protein